MQRQVFIDCDDTLILYEKVGPNPYGFYMDEPYEVNTALVERIKAWAEVNPDDSIYIWSGGGVGYARMWMDKLRLGEIAMPLGKDDALIREGDIVVDDEWSMRTHLPNEEW